MAAYNFDVVRGTTIAFAPGDTLSFAASYRACDFTLTPSGSDLILYWAGPPNRQVTLAAVGLAQLTSGQFLFADGSHIFFGTAANDLLVDGSGGSDLFVLSGGGQDTVTAGAGHDVVRVLDGFDAADALDGGGDATGAGDALHITGAVAESLTASTITGFERIVLEGVGAVALTLAHATAATAAARLVVDASAKTDSDTVVLDAAAVGSSASVELIGGSGADTLTGSAGADSLSGGEGADQLDGGDGDDTLRGGGGADTLNGGAGADLFAFGQATLRSDSSPTTIDHIGAFDGLGSAGGDLLGFGGVSAGLLLAFNAGAASFAYTGPNSGVQPVDYIGDGFADVYWRVADAQLQIWVDVNDDGQFSEQDVLIYVDGVAANATLSSGDFLGGLRLIRGTTGDDVLPGQDTADTIYGVGGNDSISGNAGADFLFGGDGADTVDGGTGNDRISGEAGGDSLGGGEGNDTITGDAGADTIDGGDGADLVVGGDLANYQNGGEDDTSSNSLSGGAGADSLYGAAGSDVLNGDGENDRIIAYAGADTIDGGEGDDTLYGGVGADLVHGGAGADFIEVGGASADHLWGDEGADTFALTGGNPSRMTAVSVIRDFNRGEGDILDLDGVYYYYVGNNLVVNGPSVFRSQSLAATFTGVNGDRFVYDGGGPVNDLGPGFTQHWWKAFTTVDGPIVRLYADLNDDGFLDSNDMSLEFRGLTSLSLADWTARSFPVLMGTPDGDTLTGGSGADTIYGVGGADTLIGNDGGDGIYGGAGDDTIDGGSGNDGLEGGDGGDTVDGGSGDDTVKGGDGGDSILGGEGLDRLAGDAGGDTIDGGAGADLITAANWIPGAGNISQYNPGGDLASNSLLGGGGNDSLYGADGADIIDGGDDDDLIVAYGGADTIDGGNGADTIRGGAGADVMNGGGGADSFVIELAFAPTLAAADAIQDFSRTDGDRIDLVSGYGPAGRPNVFRGDLGAISLVAGQALTGWSDVGAGLTQYWSAQASGTTYLIGDLDDNGVLSAADLVIEVAGSGALLASDFAAGSFAVIAGTSGADTLTGGAGLDTVYGLGGDDAIDTGDSNDLVYGGAGGDTVDGGSGNDAIEGGDGGDSLLGGDGNDQLAGDAGGDTIDGGAGADLIAAANRFYGNENYYQRGGDLASNSLLGGGGNDSIYGADGADIIDGGDDNDLITPYDGNDTVDGGAGNDTIQASTGADAMHGGAGADRIGISGGADQAWGDAGADTFVIAVGVGLNLAAIAAIKDFNGADGDRIDLGSAFSPAGRPNLFHGDLGTITLAAGQALAGWSEVGAGLAQYWTAQAGGKTYLIGDLDDNGVLGASDLVMEVASAAALQQADFTATSFAVIAGGAGADSITGGAGIDSIYGLGGADTISAGGDNDSVVGGAGDDLISGESGNDRLFGGDGADTVDGGTGQDNIEGNIGDDTIFGGDGGDGLYGDAGADWIDGGNDADTIAAGGGQYYYIGRDSNSTFDLASNTLIGGGGNDTIYGANGGDLIAGDADRDQIFALGGADTVDGGDGDDTVDGGDGADLLHGGAGVDLILIGGGADQAWGDGGADTFRLPQGSTSTLAGPVAIRDFSRTDGDRIDVAYVSKNTQPNVFRGDLGTISLSPGQALTGWADIGPGFVQYWSAQAGGKTYLIGDFDDNGVLGAADLVLEVAGVSTVQVSDFTATSFVALVGTKSGDVLTGTASNDKIYGVAGNDTISAGGGAFDEIYAGAGDDVVYGEAGNDRILGEAGNDFLDAGDGGGWITGGEGADTIYGGAGADYIEGGLNQYGFGDQFSSNSLSGGAGNDAIYGGNGDDVINGDGDFDQLFGNDGADTIAGGARNDTIDGGYGYDTAVYSGPSSNYSWQQNGSKWTVTDISTQGIDGTDQLTGVEELRFTDKTVTLVAPIVLAISPATVAVNEGATNGSGLFTFTVTRTGDLSGSTSAYWNVVGVGLHPADAADFGSTGNPLPFGIVSFSAGQSLATITVQSRGDALEETNEDFLVYLHDAAGPVLYAPGSATGTILNDDNPTTISLAASTVTVAEGNSGLTPLTFTVMRTGESTGAASANWALSGSGLNPASMSDFSGGVLPSGTVNFAAGETVKTITVDVTGDTVFETDETFTLTLSGPSTGARLGNAVADGVIQNDDQAPTLSLGGATVSKVEGASGTNAYVFTVTRTGDVSGASTADWAVSGSGANAASASDFVGGVLPTGTVNFAAGEISKTITVNVAGDLAVETLETFAVTLSNPSDVTVIAGDPATGVIVNDDKAATNVTHSSTTTVSKAEGASGTTNMSFTVTRSGDTTGSTTVDWAVSLSGVTPAQAADFAGGVLPTGQVTFGVGETSKIITIGLAADAYSEPNETFTLTLSNATGGASITTAQRTGSITNDDGTTPAFAIAGTASKAEGTGTGASYTFTVTRTGLVDAAANVDWSVAGSGTGPASAADFLGGLLPTGTLSFAAGELSKTFTVDLAGDTFFEGTETFAATLSNATAGATIKTATATGTITNDDTAPSLAIAAASFAEGDAGSTPFTFTVTRSANTTGAVTVDWSVTASGTAPADVADFAGGAFPTGSLSFADGETVKTITVMVAGDTTFEPTETFTVKLANAVGGTIKTASATGTILNDEGVLIVGTAGADTISTTVTVAGQPLATAGRDTIQGLGGNDTLNGGAGADRLEGGLGDDSYTVDNAGDEIVELAGEGNDLVTSAVSFTLAANVEKLTLSGTGAINGTGNELNNTLTGNAGANSLFGGAGNDTISGGAGADTLTGGEGNDSYTVENVGDVVVELSSEGTDIITSSVTFTLPDNVEKLTLSGTAAINGTGNELNNTLTGNTVGNQLDGLGGNDTLTGGTGNDSLNGGEGNDSLNGGLGADSLTGGNGNDTYVIDDIGDTVTEAVGEGTDLVQSTISFTLGANLENLTLTGAAAINGTGNELANLLTGNTGNNQLFGLGGNDTLTASSGNDTLDGGAGADLLTGSTGADVFVLHKGEAAGDRIADLVAGDLLQLVGYAAGSSIVRVTGSLTDWTITDGVTLETETITLVNRHVLIPGEYLFS